MSRVSVESKTIYVDEKSGKQIVLDTSDITLYLAPSRPAQKTNLTFPSAILNKDTSINYQVLDPDCEIMKFVKPNMNDAAQP